MHIARIAAEFFNTPLLISDDAAHAIEAFLWQRIVTAESGGDYKALDKPLDRAVIDSARKPYSVSDGIALIGIDGELVNRGSYVGASSGVTSYEGIAAQIKAAQADAAVNGIMLEVNSPGGSAAGLAAVQQVINSASKPIWAIANAQAASAAYWIASSADRVGVVPDGMAGSIGTVIVMRDLTKAMEKAGVAAHIIRSGGRKYRGSGMEAIDPATIARMQQVVDAYSADFFAAVAANRGISVDAVDAMDGEMFMAAEAKKLKLVDAVATVSDFHAQMVKAIRGGSAHKVSKGKPAASAISISTKGNTMSGDLVHSAADLDAAKATAHAEGVKAGEANGIKVGATAERERISAILALDEAKGREAQAQHIALKTNASVEDAKGILAAAPKVEAENPLKPKVDLLKDAMANAANGNPDVDADASLKGSGGGDDKSPQARAAQERAAAEAQFGKPQPGIR